MQDTPTNHHRSRVIYALLAAIVMLVGFLSRRLLGHFAFVKLYVGDVLWATMVFLGIAFIFPKWRAWRIGVLALTFSVCIEVSQLYHASWIDAIRATGLGGLVLGFSFVWTDLVCYGMGVALGMVIDSIVMARHKKRS